MPPKAKADAPPKRLNRTVGVAEALNKVLDPAMRKRGFASRDILSHWGAMAPAPYDAVTFPDRLHWSRGEKSAEGATLFLRCAPGHGLALAHDGPNIAKAINRYFGYHLVGQVKMAIEPLAPKAAPPPPPQTDSKVVAAVQQQTARVEDEGLRSALQHLGEAINRKSRKH